MFQERKHDILAIELGCLRVKIHAAEMITIASRPATMKPRSHHEDVVADGGIEPLDRTKNSERAKKVFAVIPATNSHHRGVDVLKVRTHIARLPEIIVVAVVHAVVPKFNFAAKIILVSIRERAEVQKEFVSVGYFVTQWFWRSSHRHFQFLGEIGGKIERVSQKKRAVVMNIVPDEPVSLRRLR